MTFVSTRGFGVLFPLGPGDAPEDWTISGSSNDLSYFQG